MSENAPTSVSSAASAESDPVVASASAATSAPTAVAREPMVVRGTLLRSILLLELDEQRHRTVSVSELVDALIRRGVTVAGRPSKVISDALRSEQTRGRVRRTGRGQYRILRLPRTSRWRARQRVAAALGQPGGAQGRSGQRPAGA